MRAWLGKENEFTFFWDRSLCHFARRDYCDPVIRPKIPVLMQYLYKDVKSLVDSEMIMLRFFPML